MSGCVGKLANMMEWCKESSTMQSFDAWAKESTCVQKAPQICYAIQALTWIAILVLGILSATNSVPFASDHMTAGCFAVSGAIAGMYVLQLILGLTMACYTHLQR